MKYQPITCVWEVTIGNNMRSNFYKSSDVEPLPDELNMCEALDICDQIAALGIKSVTFIGGEPLLRKDLVHLIRSLSDQGVSVNIITNGWALDRAIAEKLKDSGVAMVFVSINGTRDIQDSIHRKGSFEHAEHSFAILKELGIKNGAVTTVIDKNIQILNELKKGLCRMGVDTWQIRRKFPIVTYNSSTDWELSDEKVDDLIHFCRNTAKEGLIKLLPVSCNAGISSFEIRQNGEIQGCPFINNRKYRDAGLRVHSLRDIWEDNECLRWCREMAEGNLPDECIYCGLWKERQ